MADKNDTQSGNQGADGGKGRHEEHHATLLERVTGLVGAAIVLGLVGFMLYEAIWGGHSPPNIEVELVRVVPSGDDYLARIRVHNIGGNTAAGVIVSGKLVPPGTAGSKAESASVTVDYVPPGSSVEIGMFFDARPNERTLQLSADGYVQP